MKLSMTKIAAGLALALAANGAQAVAVNSMTLADVMDNTGALVTDGHSGGFAFNSNLLGVGAAYNADGYFKGISSFSGDVNGGVINLAGAAANSINPATAFTTGFIYAGSNMGPDTTGPIDADITGGVLTFNSLPWGGYYTGAGFQFNMPADAYTVNNLIQTGVDTYAYRVSFNHVITATDDPSFTYVGQNAKWIIEGTVTAAVPEASTYGMMLAGLGLVGVAVRRRRTMM